jgi:biotin carboxyl carrier protein
VPVEAPVAGRVATVACAEGQAVEEGDILVTLG